MATNKQKALAKKIVENPSLTMTEAMRAVGYSEASASKPSEVTNSIGWQELVDKMLPDEKILLRHAEGLDATKVVSSHTEPDYTVPDYGIRKQYVELAYRVKNKLKEGINIHGEKVLVIPSELMGKYGITSDAKDSSTE